MRDSSSSELTSRVSRSELARTFIETALDLGREPRLGEGEIDLGSEDRDRRAQLVARVGDELPLAIRRAPQAEDEVVQGGGEVGDVVVTGRNGQELVRGLGAEPPCGAPQPPHRGERGGREQPCGDPDQHHEEGETRQKQPADAVQNRGPARARRDHLPDPAMPSHLLHPDRVVIGCDEATRRVGVRELGDLRSE
jgi:hypothetical protein